MIAGTCPKAWTASGHYPIVTSRDPDSPDTILRCAYCSKEMKVWTAEEIRDAIHRAVEWAWEQGPPPDDGMARGRAKDAIAAQALGVVWSKSRDAIKFRRSK